MGLSIKYLRSQCGKLFKGKMTPDRIIKGKDSIRITLPTSGTSVAATDVTNPNPRPSDHNDSHAAIALIALSGVQIQSQH